MTARQKRQTQDGQVANRAYAMIRERKRRKREGTERAAATRAGRALAPLVAAKRREAVGDES